MKFDQYFLNDAYTWYSMLDLIAKQLEGEQWAFTGDIAAIVQGYANGTPIWTMPNPLIEIRVEKRTDLNQQRIDIIDGMRSFGCVVDPKSLSFYHPVFAVPCVLVFVSTLGDFEWLVYPVVSLDRLIEEKRLQAKHWSMEPAYSTRVLSRQLEELIAIAASR